MKRSVLRPGVALLVFVAGGLATHAQVVGFNSVP